MEPRLKLCSNVKVTGQPLRTQNENVSKVVGATWSECFLVSTEFAENVPQS